MSAEIALGMVLAHMVGDYLIQSHWMAVEKTKRLWPAICHGVTYTLPFLLVTRSPAALAVICITHVVIDRWRLPRHLIWAKNALAPKAFRAPHSATGYPEDTPPWLAFWLLIAADNTIHLLINFAAIGWLS